MGEKGREAKITYLPIHSGDGYGYGGGTILTIGDLSFNFGESPKAKAIADETVRAINAHDELVSVVTEWLAAEDTWDGDFADDDRIARAKDAARRPFSSRRRQMSKPFEALDADDRINFWGNDKPKCPHCGDDFDIADNEAWYLYSEDGPHDVDCPSCDREFQVSSIATWTFSTDEQGRDDAS